MEEEKIFATRLGPEGHKPVLMNPQLLVDSVPALIHTGLPDGYLDFFNQTWLNYVGASLEDLAGWKWTARIHPEDAAAMVEKWRASIATGEPFEHEARVRRADGEYRWMIHRKVALRDERGNIAKWYGSSIDVEDRKRAEEAVRRSEAYLAEALDRLRGAEDIGRGLESRHPFTGLGVFDRIYAPLRDTCNRRYLSVNQIRQKGSG
jgi:PAS domain S-box-containing protein